MSSRRAEACIAQGWEQLPVEGNIGPQRLCGGCWNQVILGIETAMVIAIVTETTNNRYHLLNALQVPGMVPNIDNALLLSVLGES